MKEIKTESTFRNLVKQGLSFLVGFLFCWYPGDWTAIWIKNWSAQYVAPGFDTAIYWVAYVGFITYFGFYGLKKLKPFWNGVPILLGQPIPWYIIPDGRFWQLPEPIMSFINVFIGQKDLDIAIKKALSQDNVEIDVDALVQAKVSDPYKWASVENPDKALKTLVERNIRVYTNTKHSTEMPGQKVKFSTNLEDGVDISVLDKEGNAIMIEDKKTGNIIEKTVKIESVPIAAEQWGYGSGIAKCIINDIRLPDEMVKANTEKEVEKAQVFSETTQQNLFLSLLGGGGGKTDEENVAKGRKIWETMSGEERAKIVQAERGKRKVITVDGNAGDFTKGGVAGAEVRR